MNATNVLPALRGRNAVAVVQQHCELVGVGHTDELIGERPTGVLLVGSRSGLGLWLGLGVGFGFRFGFGFGFGVRVRVRVRVRLRLGERSGAVMLGRHHATPSLDNAMHALPVPELPFQVHEQE